MYGNKKCITDRLYEQLESSDSCELDKAVQATHTEQLNHADTVEQLMADLMR